MGNTISQEVTCVAAILRNPQGRILLQRRDEKLDVPFAGYWTLPGGKVEDGETPEDAIEREVLEEIELEVPFSQGRFMNVLDLVRLR